MLSFKISWETNPLAFPMAYNLCEHDPMASSDYTPPDDAAQLFTRYKRHLEGERALRDPVREMAARELKAGASVKQLAEWTGMTDEVFRRIARAEGVERRRAPTVGKEAEALRAGQEETPEG